MNVACHPDNRRILVAKNDVVYGSRSLFLIDRNGIVPDEVIPGQPRQRYISGAEWTQDGKRIAFACLPEMDEE